MKNSLLFNGSEGLSSLCACMYSSGNCDLKDYKIRLNSTPFEFLYEVFLYLIYAPDTQK